jgi:UDP-glucuronate decarboxylase
MNVDGVHDPVNLGNPGEFTIKELANEVVKICNSNSGLEYLPLPQDDPKQRQPDISRAQTLLDWNPTIPLHEGLQKTVAYFKDRMQTAVSEEKAASGAEK